MKRNVRAILLAVTASTLALTAACSSGTAAPNPNEKVELTFWSWVPGIDKVVAAWNTAHPNIHVTVSKQAQGDEEDGSDAQRKSVEAQLAQDGADRDGEEEGHQRLLFEGRPGELHAAFMVPEPPRAPPLAATAGKQADRGAPFFARPAGKFI